MRNQRARRRPCPQGPASCSSHLVLCAGATTGPRAASPEKLQVFVPLGSGACNSPLPALGALPLSPLRSSGRACRDRTDPVTRVPGSAFRAPGLVRAAPPHRPELPQRSLEQPAQTTTLSYWLRVRHLRWWPLRSPDNW
ncbi:hypothetical protein NDU88_005220 [Pleurodeles waltl]|uniref:Uncharacterized protein n=1 Tax=Pleurodeles waltl TaxID=8319 RepID=A0AAV7MWU2_PLEWA|nr:hypothetical protein NDU88_005220 [Pleurodeles waltl]